MDEKQELEFLREEKKLRDEKAKDEADQLARAEKEAFQKGVEEFKLEIPKLREEIKLATGTKVEEQTGASQMAHALADIHGYNRGLAKVEGGKIIRDVLMENGKVVTRVADPVIVGTDASGGFLVPDLTQGNILEYAMTYGQAFQIGMTQLPMGQNIVSIPTELTNPTWSWDIDEGATIGSSKPTFTVTTLTPNKGGAIVVISPEMLMGAYLPIGAYVNKKIGIARAYGTDGQVFVGSGSPFTGLFTSGITWGKTVTMDGVNINTLKYRDFTNAKYGIDQAKIVGASFLMNRLVMEQTRNIMDEIGRPMFVEANGDTPATILGIPVKLIEQAPSAGVASTPVVLLGNFSNSIIGNVQGAMRMRMLYEGTIDTTSLAQYDLVGIRVVDQMAYNNGTVLNYSAIQCPAA